MHRFDRFLVSLMLCTCRPTEGSPRNEASETDKAGTMTSGSEASAVPSESGENRSADHDRIELPTLVEVNDGRFTTSPACASCHSATDGASALKDEAGRDISPFELWQATMMANASRDPFWWAMVTAERLATPSLAEAIEGKCTQCHAPIAGARPELWENDPMTLEQLVSDSVRGQLGLDGVACSACHKIGDEGLDTGTQWSGHLDLRADAVIFGPHPDPFTMPMLHHTGLTPTQADHFERSSFCAGCHTLDTTPVDPGGTPLGGHYSEQSPYLEWLNSEFNNEGPNPSTTARTCQDCHMPRDSEDGVPISTRIARRPMGDDFPPIDERSPFHRHSFVGGNSLIPAILRDHSEELHPQASAAAFDAVIARATAQLQQNTATVALQGLTRDGDTLVIDVRAENLAGHKLPTGFPSRRLWIDLMVRDAHDAVVFRSGGVNTQGRLVDTTGTVIASESVGGPTQPHHQTILKDTQVQVYETIMSNGDGEAVFRLLRAERDLKDNRLLPRGWSHDGAYMDRIGPELGGDDANFVGGSDNTEYRVNAPPAAGPYTIDVRLLYQPISTRFAEELFAWDAPEINAFERMWDATNKTPVTVATASTTAQ